MGPRWLRLLAGAIVGCATLALAVGAVSAASAAKPRNTRPPTISGTPQAGAALHGTRGKWRGHPTDFNVWWQRCGRSGGSCANISGSGGSYSYRLTSADVGNTLRFAVGAANGDGRTWATSVPTAIIATAPAPAPAPAPPPRGPGCPPRGNPDNVAGIGPPARLLLDGLQGPSVVTRQTATLILRFHVSSTCGGPVQGALVYVTATPFDQFAIPPEQPTGPDGWAEVQMQRLAGFPVSPRQQLIALFVRARKAGDNLLAGITARRLFSVRVNLNA
jgi:hypothetical protein